MAIDEDALNLITPQGFNRAFDKLMGEYPKKSLPKVYEMLEKRYEFYFNQNRYSSFKSFSNVRARLIKSKKI
jgi:hypothetical protein